MAASLAAQEEDHPPDLSYPPKPPDISAFMNFLPKEAKDEMMKTFNFFKRILIKAKEA